MIKIIATTKERIKKFNIFGADISIAFAKYGLLLGLKSFQPNTWQTVYKDINYLYDHEEKDGIITTRLLLWRFKFEIKTVVEYDFLFA